MTEANNSSEGESRGNGIEELIQSMLMRQEQQFNKLLQENYLQNQSIFEEVGQINKRLTSLESNILPTDIPKLLTAGPSPKAQHDQLEPEKSLGHVDQDHTGLPVISASEASYPEDGQETQFIKSQNVSLDANINDPKGDNLVLEIEAQMEKFLQEHPEDTLFKHLLGGEAGGKQEEIADPEREEGAGRCKELEDSVQLLKYKLSSLEKTHNSLLERYSMINKEKSELGDRAEEIRDKLEAMRRESMGSDEKGRAEMSRLQSMVKRLEDQVKQDDDLLKSMQRQRDDVERRNKEKEDMVQALLEDKSYFSSKVEEQEKTINELRPLVEGMQIYRIRCSKLELELGSLSEDHKKKCNEFNYVRDQMNQVLSICEKQNAEKEQQMGSIQGYERVTREKDHMIKDLRGEKHELLETMKVHYDSIQILENELLAKGKECQRLRENTAQQAAELEGKNKQFNELLAKMEAKKNLEQQMNIPYFQSLAPQSGAYGFTPGSTYPSSYHFPHQDDSYPSPSHDFK